MKHLESELGRAERISAEMGGQFERQVDSVYLGGGTPSVLAPDQLKAVFQSVRNNFEVLSGSEITVEVAPGTLSPEILKVLVDAGVNRVSLGMQSFVDQETRSVGRLHNREITLKDLANLREAGISEISLDLIAGLPYQTAESWTFSLNETIATRVPHVSVYMLEVDEDSRLGRELIAGGTRYHAHHVPNEDQTADFYSQACERLNGAAIHQYEISNFARDNEPRASKSGLPFHASRHNLKYWLRQPYLGFGVDAHSMLLAGEGEAVRFSTTDNLDALLDGASMTRTRVTRKNALEEEFFLGLRLNRGVDFGFLRELYGKEDVALFRPQIAELVQSGLLTEEDGFLRLTERGRLLSNEVFSRFLLD